MSFFNWGSNLDGPPKDIQLVRLPKHERFLFHTNFVSKNKDQTKIGSLNGGRLFAEFLSVENSVNRQEIFGQLLLVRSSYTDKDSLYLATSNNGDYA